MSLPLAGTSTGAAGKASPHLQAWYDEKEAAEKKRRQLEGEPEPEKKGFGHWFRSTFRPVSYPKELWEAKGGKGGVWKNKS